jgi:hypothetical protein
MALAIALTIVVISLVKNPVVKAIVYGLPIPITVTLIASQKGVGTSHIVGLFLLTAFLWAVCWLREKGLNIFVADIVSTMAYVGAGYALTRLEIENGTLFVLFSFSYFCLWLVFFLLWPRESSPAPSQKKGVNVAVKGVIVFSVATVLLALKELLRGVVVTFPFSGVFTVVEMRDQTSVLRGEFTRNSVAILIFFIFVHFTASIFGLYLSIVAGWVIYLLVLKTVLFLGRGSVSK